MNNHPRKSRIATALSGFLIACAAVVADHPGADGAPLFDDPVIARGKGFEIRQSELDDAYIDFKAYRSVLGQPIPGAIRERIQSELLDRLIAARIFVLRATAADRKTAEELADAFIAEQRRKAPSEASFRRQIIASGLTEERFRNQVIEQAIIKTVIERELHGSVNVTEDEIREFYEGNAEAFTEPESVRVQHILVSSHDPATGAELDPFQRERKRGLALKILERAKQGDSFGNLVSEFSEDLATKERGGEYHLIRSRENPARLLLIDFESAAFALSPGEISDVIETRFGFHIVKCIEKTPQKRRSLDEVRELILEELTRREIQRALPEHTRRLREQANVEILEPLS